MILAKLYGRPQQSLLWYTLENSVYGRDSCSYSYPYSLIGKVSLMSANQPFSQLDSFPRTTIETALTDAREEFLALVASLSDTDFKRKSTVSIWTVKELLVHVVFWLQQTPRAVTLVRDGKSPPHIPGVLFDRINIWLTRLSAWHQDRESIINKYEQAFQAVVQLAEGIQEQEWQRGALFGAPFYEYRTVEKILCSHHTHVHEHAIEIRQSL
jgi:hypothetical protein